MTISKQKPLTPQSHHVSATPQDPPTQSAPLIPTKTHAYPSRPHDPRSPDIIIIVIIIVIIIIIGPSTQPDRCELCMSLPLVLKCSEPRRRNKRGKVRTIKLMRSQVYRCRTVGKVVMAGNVRSCQLRLWETWTGCWFQAVYLERNKLCAQCLWIGKAKHIS
jgi:hypothetical protein